MMRRRHERAARKSLPGRARRIIPLVQRSSLLQGAPKLTLEGLTGEADLIDQARGMTMKFLVVDDSATMRRIVVNSLNRIGYSQTAEAGDGDEALDVFNSSIDCIITDWNMPRMSGLDLVKKLRARPDGQSVPILMVTTRSVREDIIAAIEAGVSNYIVKPFTPGVLKEKLDQILSRNVVL
jgi:two-component system, chemotaxis family, chemotaxis protein CheY